MSISEFYKTIERYSEEINLDKNFSINEYLLISRLWNTICYYTTLQSSPTGRIFFTIVRDKMLPKIVDALQMKVSRGYSFYSQEFNFMLGGILEERFRYVIEELETQKN